MPTKRAIFVFCFSIVLLIGAWASKLVLMYFSFSAAVALLLISYVFSKFLLFNIHISRYIPQQAYEGEKITVNIKIKNRISLFDCSIQIEDIFPASARAKSPTIYLNGIAKGEMRFSYQQECYKRGRYKIGPFKIKVFEPLGMFYLEKSLSVYSELIVYPRTFQVQSLPFILGHLAPRYGEQTTRISGNYEEFYGIREYQKEDGWRRIHWRSTARLSELMVKHFEQSSQWRATLVLDCAKTNNIGQGKENTFEYSIKILASLMKYLLHKNASFGFLADDGDNIHLPMNKGRDHFYRIMDKLAVIESSGDTKIHHLLARCQWSIPDSSSLIIATNSFDQNTVKFLNYLKIQKNIGIIPVIINSESFLVDRIDKQNRVLKLKAVKNVFNSVTSQVYVINKNDSLKMHFVR